MELIDLNPWWRNGEVEEEYKKSIERPLLNEILKFIDNKQILSIVGLRRVGKTTLIHQIINYLLNKKVKKENIFYYNFDMGKIEIEELINKYESIAKIKLKEEKIYIFLDEIQKLDNWNNKLKLIYDLNKNIKFFITGSASLFIEKKTKESLAGRTFSFNLNILTFREFLNFKNFEIQKNLEIWKEEINKLFISYLKTGGFPELVNEKNEEKIKIYIKESVLDRLVYIDIPQVFKIDEPELLLRLINIISSNPGIIIDYNNLADDLNRNRKTISSYLFYLEKAFLIKKFYNFSQNILTSEKKGKKFYPISTAFAYFFNVDLTKLIENIVAINVDTQFFYRKQNQEVDFIKIENTKKISAIEVKYKENIKKDDISGLKHFYNKFKNKFNIKLFLITKNSEKELKINHIKLNMIIIWKWLLK